MKNTTFGLDIGTTTIKVVALERNNNVTSYATAYMAPTPIQGMQSESPFDHQEMAQIINKLVIDAKITTNNVALALPESHAFTKVIEMPVLSDKELVVSRILKYRFAASPLTVTPVQVSVFDPEKPVQQRSEEIEFADQNMSSLYVFFQHSDP